MNSARQYYTVDVKPESKVVIVTFSGSSMNFKTIQSALIQLKSYIIEGYQIKLRGYMTRKSSSLKAFMFALSLVGQENRIIFENKARYSKAERRRKRVKARELRRKGFTAKQISRELKIPLKTVYRWLKEA
ncbi:MAG: helix-turn-helix domain-containing protein [archaeon GB-1867-005]|nr:helix-turn-helix domain-containing protein [Candidatus Culexmicrobium cathedralense]